MTKSIYTFTEDSGESLARPGIQTSKGSTINLEHVAFIQKEDCTGSLHSDPRGYLIVFPRLGPHRLCE